MHSRHNLARCLIQVTYSPLLLALTYAAATSGTSQTVRGGAEGGQARGGKEEQRGGRTERRGAEPSGRVTEGGGEDEECRQRETESEQSHQAVEPRAGGATQPAPSDR